MSSGSAPVWGPLAFGIIKTIVIFWIANVVAKMIYVLPEWERIVLLRMGKSVGVRGPGFFIIPPFLYSVARIIDIRISTYEVKATRTLTMDNIPVDITAAIELEVENPEKAAIDVKDYWKTTEWASMEALKSTIGSSDLRTLLSETEKISAMLKSEIDAAATDYGVNVRAVRVTDVAAPPSLIEELAVIARAERSAKAKRSPGPCGDGGRHSTFRGQPATPWTGRGDGTAADTSASGDVKGRECDDHHLSYGQPARRANRQRYCGFPICGADE